MQSKAMPLSKYDKAIDIVSIQNPDALFEDNLQIVNYEATSLQQTMTKLSNKHMDVIFALDGACIKKDGKYLVIMPSLRLLQSVVGDQPV